MMRTSSFPQPELITRSLAPLRPFLPPQTPSGFGRKDEWAHQSSPSSGPAPSLCEHEGCAPPTSVGLSSPPGQQFSCLSALFTRTTEHTCFVPQPSVEAEGFPGQGTAKCCSASPTPCQGLAGPTLTDPPAVLTLSLSSAPSEAWTPPTREPHTGRQVCDSLRRSQDWLAGYYEGQFSALMFLVTEPRSSHPLQWPLPGAPSAQACWAALLWRGKCLSGGP